MEYDRYAQNKGLFIISMISLLIFFICAAFALYIMPALVWNWHYDVPEFTITFREWIRRAYELTESIAGFWVFVIFLSIGIIAGLISKSTSNQIENEIYKIEPEEAINQTALKKDLQQSMSLSLKIIVLILLTVALVFLVEWLIAIPPGV